MYFGENTREDRVWNYTIDITNFYYMITKVRNSNFELLRIVAMFFIVTYHIIAKTTMGEYVSSPYLSMVTMPLHIGVICFLLITGYYGVELSLKKIVNLGGVTIFYNVLVYLVYSIIVEDFSLLRFGASFFPICLNPDLWFIRTYILFLLCTPVINYWLKNTTKEIRLLTLVSLAFMSLYVGCFGNDDSFQEGKNVVNFCFLYVVGNELHQREFIKDFKMSSLLFSYVVLNVVVCLATYFLTNTSFFPFFKELVWYYDSPLLILNAVLLFMVFEQIKVQSIVLNNIAKSVFPIYLIHANLYTGRVLWPYVNSYVEPEYSLSLICFIALIIMFLCIAIDKLLVLFYKRMIELIYNKILTTRLFLKYTR